MSWDAELINDATGAEEAWFNYTHNTNYMIAEALESYWGCANAKEIGSDHPFYKAIGPPWWQRLDGCDGPTGASFLHDLITALEADPNKYIAMNPPNGWGSYDTLLKVLYDMMQAVPEWPCTWKVSG